MEHTNLDQKLKFHHLKNIYKQKNSSQKKITGNQWHPISGVELHNINFIFMLSFSHAKLISKQRIFSNKFLFFFSLFTFETVLSDIKIFIFVELSSCLSPCSVFNISITQITFCLPSFKRKVSSAFFSFFFLKYLNCF